MIALIKVLRVKISLSLTPKGKVYLKNKASMRWQFLSFLVLAEYGAYNQSAHNTSTPPNQPSFSHFQNTLSSTPTEGFHSRNPKWHSVL